MILWSGNRGWTQLDESLSSLGPLGYCLKQPGESLPWISLIIHQADLDKLFHVTAYIESPKHGRMGVDSVCKYFEKCYLHHTCYCSIGKNKSYG